MKREKITILGEEIELAFNLAVQIAYEDITKEAFDLTKMDTRKKEIALYMAAIIANNPDTGITMTSLMNEATMEDIKKIDDVLSEKIKEWYHITDLNGNGNDKSAKKQKHSKRP